MASSCSGLSRIVISCLAQERTGGSKKRGAGLEAGVAGRRPAPRAARVPALFSWNSAGRRATASGQEGLLCDQVDWRQYPGGERLQVVQVLGLEAFTVLGGEGFVIGQRTLGQFVDGEVADGDADGVRTGVEQGANFEFIGRTPDGAGAAAVDEDYGGFANRTLQHGAHAVAGSTLLGGDGSAFAEI